jgi:indolepyruvate ferredoxin oxidoreductase alpha subunit
MERARELVARVDRLVVLEEGAPHVERQLGASSVANWAAKIEGRLSGHVPATGELTPDIVRRALGLPAPAPAEAAMTVAPRPPRLCQGCPHSVAYEALVEALKAIDPAPEVITGDIGCYTLGALPPYQAIQSCVCMGASVGMAKGAADVLGGPTVAIIGDSTFVHSGVQPLVDAIAHDTPLTLVLLDNQVVGMTGQQPTALADDRLLPLVLALGIDPDHARVLPARAAEHANLVEHLRAEIEHPGPSVLILRRECVVSVRARRRRGEV